MLALPKTRNILQKFCYNTMMAPYWEIQLGSGSITKRRIKFWVQAVRELPDSQQSCLVNIDYIFNDTHKSKYIDSNKEGRNLIFQKMKVKSKGSLLQLWLISFVARHVFNRLTRSHSSARLHSTLIRKRKGTPTPHEKERKGRKEKINCFSSPSLLSSSRLSSDIHDLLTLYVYTYHWYS